MFTWYLGQRQLPIWVYSHFTLLAYHHRVRHLVLCGRLSPQLGPLIRAFRLQCVFPAEQLDPGSFLDEYNPYRTVIDRIALLVDNSLNLIIVSLFTKVLATPSTGSSDDHSSA